MAQIAPLLTDEDLVELVGVGGATSVADPRLRRAARRVSADFRAAIGHPLTRAVGDRQVFDGDGSTVLRLNVWEPLVESVTVAGEPLLPGAVEASRVGLLRLAGGGRWPYGYGNIVIALDHGVTDVPEDVRAVLLEAVELRLSIPIGIKQTGLGNHNVTFENRGTTQAWADAVAAWALGRGDRA